MITKDISRLIMDEEELNFIIADTTAKNTFCNREDAVLLSRGGKIGTTVSYIDGDSAQYTHLRYSMLCYVSINVLLMVNRVPDTELRVATDSIYVNEKHLTALDKFITASDGQWGTWRVKKEMLHK